MNKKNITIAVIAIIILCGGFWSYQKYLSPTKIALVNYPDFLSSKIARATDNSFIDIDLIEPNDMPNLKKYDMLLIFGMGLKLTAEQQKEIEEAGQKGTSIYLQASTTKGLELTNLNDSIKKDVEGYLNNGGNKNYKNLLNYIRIHVDNKNTFVEAPDSVFEISSDVLFHIDEEVAFEKVGDYETYCKQNGFYHEGQPKILLITSIPGPYNSNREHLNSMLTELNNRNYNVYPVSGFKGRLHYMKEINPDLIIYLPHGRLSLGGSTKAIEEQLKKMNVPILCPLTVHQLYDDWLKDKNGMMGGLLSQSVTMPEFDGGIVPYACFAEEVDKNGYVIFKAIPNRLQKFADMVSNYLDLQTMDNSNKKVAIVYFKGPGKNALTASNMEVLPSMHNFLLRLKKEGYNLGDLPLDFETFKNRIMTEGPVLGPYAQGAFDNYLKNGNPELINVKDYNQWCAQTLPKELIQDVENKYGKAPGAYMNVYQNQEEYIAMARVQFGNIVVLPQQLPGLGDNTFELVHGAKVAPPHTYIAPYLWIQKNFKANAIIHFGTHGSLEFTPGKQIALSDYDWTDPLIGSIPHNYIYTISNVGEGMIAKRRSYAATQTYLTPPFIKAKGMESMHVLQNKVNAYGKAKGALQNEYALSIKKILIEKGMHKELGLDSIEGIPYTQEEMERVHNYLEEISTEKVTGGLYTMGVPYTASKIDETITMMHNDELAYRMAEVDVLAGRVSRDELKNRAFFRNKYTTPAEKWVKKALADGNIQKAAQQILLKRDILRAEAWKKQQDAKQKIAKEMAIKHAQKTNVKADSKKTDAHSGASSVKTEENLDEKAFAEAVFNVKNTLLSVLDKKIALQNSPEEELKAVLNALNGRYTAPTPGGDPVANPETIPTGRNLFSVNAEQTPSKEAWNVAKKLGDDLLADYKKKHGAYPQKVSFTLWSSAFIESEGTTIAQILYMLGVEPIWTPRGKVNDIRLMSEDELGRPRIDVVVQTSGQLRDLAASRLSVINKAIALAADAQSSKEINNVAKGIADAEKLLIEKGFSPKEVKKLARQRVFGGLNGNYGASIMGMVEASDRWDSTQTVAQTYIHNMGAFYGSEEEWGEFNAGVFEAALLNTEAVVQPRQSNTWGALSLDHVYEFMGGLNLAVREVTGNDAESYFNDFRNRSNPRIQGLKEAISVESRTTLLNERYIKELMKGKASSADVFAETFRNTFGWNVMKPSVIEDRLWDDLYDVYVQDKLKLNVQDFFKRENPYALQEMTAVMLETARKGMWQATQEQVKTMAELHANLVKEHQAGCSGFVCDNAKLKDFVSQHLNAESKDAYQQNIKEIREQNADKTDNVVLKKENEKIKTNNVSAVKVSANYAIIIGSLVVILLLITIVIRKRKNK